jgi:hypothetical protein
LIGLDEFDPYGYLYLNPLLGEHFSVEDAYYHNFSNTIGREMLKYDLSIIPPDFDYKVFYHFHNTDINSFFSPQSYDYMSNDIERKSKIHYLNIDPRPTLQYKIDSGFNPYLYRLFHKVTQEIPESDLYYDYIQRLDNSDLVVGNMDDLTMYIRSNQSLRFHNLVVDNYSLLRNNVYCQNNLYVAGTVEINSGEFVVSGGTFQINSDYTALDNVDNILNIEGNTNPLRDIQYSDSRTQTNVSNLNISNCYSNIMRVDLKTYQKIGYRSPTEPTYVGAVSGEIQNIFPDIVYSTGITHIPNINSNMKITSHDILAHSDLSLPLGILENDIVIQINENTRINTRVLSVSTSNLTVMSNTFTQDWFDTDVFVYGFKVDSLTNIDYQQLFINLVGAVQHLSTLISA